MKSKMTRVTVSLPGALLEAADGKLAEENESRSALVRRLLEAALREAAERDDVERWVQAYRKQPQTEDEVGWMEQVALEHLAEIPWE